MTQQPDPPGLEDHHPIDDVEIAPRHLEFPDLREKTAQLDPADPGIDVTRRALMWQRTREAVELKLAGNTNEQIAEHLGIAGSTVRKYLRDALKESALEVADNVRDVELTRMMLLDRTFWPMARTGDVKAARIVIETMQRRAKMLGLDAPQKLEFKHVVMDEAERMAAELGIPIDELQRELEMIIEGAKPEVIE